MFRPPHKKSINAHLYPNPHTQWDILQSYFNPSPKKLIDKKWAGIEQNNASDGLMNATKSKTTGPAGSMSTSVSHWCLLLTTKVVISNASG